MESAVTVHVPDVLPGIDSVTYCRTLAVGIETVVTYDSVKEPLRRATAKVPICELFAQNGQKQIFCI